MARVKSHIPFKRRYSNPLERSNTSVLCDKIAVLTVFYSSKGYPAALRRVAVKDGAGKRITLLTNNFALKPNSLLACSGNAGR